MATLSKEFWLVAYFLSRFGNKVDEKSTAPPLELETTKWKEVYNLFYKKFGKDKTGEMFENSLKNCRDAFDGHIESSHREGWRDINRKPVKLTPLAKSVFNKYSTVGRESIWKEIKAMLSIEEHKAGMADKTKKTNPDWTREELILALDLYFDLDQGQMHKGHPDVIRVSNELRQLNIHEEIPDAQKFRNPSGISRRLGNFKTMDSDYKGDGLINSGKLAKEVYKEFHHHRDKLRKEANLIRQLYLKPESKNKLYISESKGNYRSEFLFRVHKNREEDPLANKMKKEVVFTNTKSLKCEICSFDSLSVYGEVGRDLMEIHYSKELINNPAIKPSSMEDFIIVCSNCHKALDKNFGILLAEDLKKIIRKR